MPKWTNEQMDAISKSGTNIIVSAGAGSGKTAVLTERVLTKIKNGISISELLILTFTNAAAHEMKERIRKALKKEKITSELDLIDSAYITTFDSYALSIVKKYHYLLGLPKKINIIDGTFISAKKQEFLEQIMEDYYKNNNGNFQKFIKDFCVKEDTELTKCILSIYDKLSNKKNFNDYINNYINSHYSEDFFKNSFDKYMYILMEKISLLEDLWKKIGFEVDGDYYTKLSNVINPLLNANGYDEIKACSNIRIPVLKESTELGKSLKLQITSIIKQIDLMTESTFEELKADYFSTKGYVEIILEIVEKLYYKIGEYKRNINYFEFNDVALMAIEILENNENIRLELKTNFKEIMIDEYQDTNDLQEYFISLIENNNVYMVGDIKQSIYRFRNANPELFRSKYNLYQKNNGGYKIDLNKNFRSRKEILNDINIIFDLIMNDNIGGAEYRESHEMIFGNSTYEEEGKIEQNQNLEIYNYNYELKDLSKDEVEAFIIGRDIIDKISSGYKVFDKDTKVLRPCEYQDFVVLMDRTTCFDTYKRIFEYLGIPTTLFKDENIMEEIEISLIKNYLRLILKIKNRNYDKEFRYVLTSLARSYLYEISDDEIFNYFENNNFYDSIVFKDALELSESFYEKSANDLLNEILVKTHFYNKILHTNKIEQKIMVIDYLKNIFEDLMDIGLNLEEICDYLDKIQSNSREIKVSKPISDTSSVKIMTIFKSKGLEFHVCYMSSLYKQFNIRELNSLFFYDESLGIIPSCFNEGINDTYLKVIAKNNYILENISERIRLFYVALTRCKEKMIILSNIKDEDYNNIIDSHVSKEVKLSYKSFNEFLKSIAGNLLSYIKNVNCEKLDMSKKYLQVVEKDYNSLVEKSNIIHIKNVTIENEEMLENHFSKEMHDLININVKNNLDLGIKFHSILENIDLKHPDLEILNLNDYEQKVINNFLSLDILKDINNANIYQEYEFIYEENNNIFHGVIDLLLVFDDHIDIIDYKLKNIDDPKYIKQLTGYKNFICGIFDKNVNLYLYSISENILKKV